jgi:5-methylcytosine-specific restriction protein A
MRRSKVTNTLVLISDHTRGGFRDRWQGSILHYAGISLAGDQGLDYRQNKTLKESDTNGVEVHLFEVFRPGEFFYHGIVKLAGRPFQEKQSDDNDNGRLVWMFPLQKA